MIVKAVGEGFEPSRGDSVIDKSACKQVVYPNINYLFLCPCRRDWTVCLPYSRVFHHPTIFDFK